MLSLIYLVWNAISHVNIVVLEGLKNYQIKLFSMGIQKCVIVTHTHTLTKVTHVLCYRMF